MMVVACWSEELAREPKTLETTTFLSTSYCEASISDLQPSSPPVPVLGQVHSTFYELAA